MKKLFRLNLILSAVALVMVFSSYHEEYMMHPRNPNLFLMAICWDCDNGGHLYTDLGIAYSSIKAHGDDTSIPWNVSIRVCSSGLWFDPELGFCTFPEIAEKHYPIGYFDQGYL